VLLGSGVGTISISMLLFRTALKREISASIVFGLI
jgi:hypothetical protein